MNVQVAGARVVPVAGAGLYRASMRAAGTPAALMLLAWAVLGVASVSLPAYAHGHTHTLQRVDLLDAVPRSSVEARGRLEAAMDHPQEPPPRSARPAREPGDSRFSIDERSHDESSRLERPGAGVPWEALSEGQRELLSKYQAQWDQLPMGRQRALARGAQRWLRLPPEQREEAQRRFEHWQSLDPAQRRELRRRYQEFKMLPAQERERIRRGFHDFQHLTPEQRREMRKRFHELSPEERRQLKEHRRRARDARHGDHAPRGEAPREIPGETLEKAPAETPAETSRQGTID